MKKIFISVCILLVSVVVCAQRSEVFIKSGLAIGGYDPVAYFNQQKPVLGLSQFKYNWMNADWLFANRQNLDAFKSSPEKFAPQYGGYCAYGMSQGHKASTDPDAWTIVNGKLYLNYSPKVKVMWSENRDEKIKTADINWPALKNKE